MMPRTVHIIRKRERHENISDHSVVVGVVLQGWQHADLIVERLNAQDEDRPLWGRNYWKDEIDVLRLDDAGNVLFGE